MSIKKTVAIAAAAGAMAAIAVPAMALENEFHGFLNFNAIGSNIQNGWAGQFNPGGKEKSPKMNNYFDQRARLQYTAKVSDDLKMVTQFELDTRWGGIKDDKYTNSSDAGVLDTDGINLETKHVYMDYNLGKDFNTKIGLQPYKDTIKGVFLDADLPAIATTTKFGAYTLGIAYSRFDEAQQSGVNTTTRIGDLAADMVMLDNSFAFSKDTKAALSYYLYANYKTPNKAKLINTLAVSGETKFGALSLSGFAAIQAGHEKQSAPNGTSLQYHGWAANVGAKMPVGPGTAKTAFLFTSGDNTSSTDSHTRGWFTPLNSYNESGMMILVRNTGDASTTSDVRMRRPVTNVAILTMGYDANITDKVYANGNVGFAWTPASHKETGVLTKNSSDFMGTELNLEGGYKVNPNLTLSAEAAYVILGGLYKDTAPSGTDTPENPYTMRLMAKMKF